MLQHVFRFYWAMIISGKYPLSMNMVLSTQTQEQSPPELRTLAQRRVYHLRRETNRNSIYHTLFRLGTPYKQNKVPANTLFEFESGNWWVMVGDRLGLNMTQHSLARDIIGLDNTTEQLRFREAFIAVVVEVLKPTLQHFVFQVHF